MKRLIGPAVIGSIVLGGSVAILYSSEEAREVAGEAVWNVFRFFTTPFILELSVALFGILAVMTYNQWKQSKDDPEWVEMEVPNKDEPEKEPRPPAAS